MFLFGLRYVRFRPEADISELSFLNWRGQAMFAGQVFSDATNPQGLRFLPRGSLDQGEKSGCEMIAGSIGAPSSRATGEENKPIRLIFVDDDDDYREAATAEIVDFGFCGRWP